MENDRVADTQKGIMALGASRQGKVVLVTPDKIEGAIQLEIQRELSDIRKKLKRGRTHAQKEE